MYELHAICKAFVFCASMNRNKTLFSGIGTNPSQITFKSQMRKKNCCLISYLVMAEFKNINCRAVCMNTKLYLNLMQQDIDRI